MNRLEPIQASGSSYYREEPQTALLIDFENLICGLNGSAQQVFDAGLLLQFAEAHGRVATARAYADWRWHQYNEHQGELYNKGIELMHVLGRGNKNAVDLRLAVDAVAMIYERPHIQTYVIVSGDRDFIHVLKKLREHNKQVIGIAPRGSASEDLARLCDRFVTYQMLWSTYRSEDSSATVAADSAPLDLLKAQLHDMFRDHVGHEGILGANLKPLIRRHISTTFDEAAYGYDRLSRLMEAFPDVIRIERSPGGSDVRLYGVNGAGVSHGELVSGAPVTRSDTVARIRAKLNRLALDWDRGARDGFLTVLHEALVARPSFSLNGVVGELSSLIDADDNPISPRRIADYLGVCERSQMFERVDASAPAPSPWDEVVRLRQRLETFDGFAEHFELSMLLMTHELLPTDPTEQAAVIAAVLELDAELERDYITDVMARLERHARK